MYLETGKKLMSCSPCKSAEELFGNNDKKVFMFLGCFLMAILEHIELNLDL